MNDCTKPIKRIEIEARLVVIGAFVIAATLLSFSIWSFCTFKFLKSDGVIGPAQARYLKHAFKSIVFVVNPLIGFAWL